MPWFIWSFVAKTAIVHGARDAPLAGTAGAHGVSTWRLSTTCYMNLPLKHRLAAQTYAPQYGLHHVTFTIFFHSTGYQSLLSATDMSYAVTALLENMVKILEGKNDVCLWCCHVSKSKSQVKRFCRYVNEMIKILFSKAFYLQFHCDNQQQRWAVISSWNPPQ